MKANKVNSDNQDAILAHKDNLSFMRGLESESMKLIVTSPRTISGSHMKNVPPLRIIYMARRK